MAERAPGAAHAFRAPPMAPHVAPGADASGQARDRKQQRRQPRPTAKRRAWMATALLLLALSAARVATPQSDKPVVHVFLQLDTKSGALERILQQQLPTLGVTVFSRYRDLEDAAASNPDALVAIRPVLEQRGQSTLLQGVRNGKDAEPYLLVSVGRPLDGPLSGKTIGAVDVMGRDGTQRFVAALLKTQDVRVKRVAKTEDLLALLEFSAADGVLIPSAALDRLTERTRLAIKTKEVPGGPIGLPAVAVFNGANKETVVKAFLRLDAATNKILGVDAWSAR